MNYLEALAEELTRGTIIPHVFTREHLKLLSLALLPQDHAALPWHPTLHARQYLLLVSDAPQTGKSESWRRARATIDKAEQEAVGDHSLLNFISGDGLGSPQFAVIRFGGVSSKVKKNLVIEIVKGNTVVFYDEGRALAQRDTVGRGDRGLVTLFTSLFESNAAETGSFENGFAQIRDANVSLTMSFTTAGFQASFTGSGAVAGGFLSRCTLVHAARRPHSGDWRNVDRARVQELVRGLYRLFTRPSIPIEAGVDKIRHEVEARLAGVDSAILPRLSLLFNQDLLIRGITNEDGLTVNEANAAGDWIEKQISARSLLWPNDFSPNVGERMQHALLTALRKGPRTARQLQMDAHVFRAGSGGVEVFRRVLFGLVEAGLAEKTSRGKTEAYQMAEDEG